MVTSEYKLYWHCCQAGQRRWLVSNCCLSHTLYLMAWFSPGQKEDLFSRSLKVDLTHNSCLPVVLHCWNCYILGGYCHFSLLFELHLNKNGSMKYRFVWNWMVAFHFVQLAWNAGQSELGTRKVPTVQHQSVYAESGKSPVPHVGSSPKPPAARPSHQDHWSQSHFVMWTWHPRNRGPAEIRNGVCVRTAWSCGCWQGELRWPWPSTLDQNLYALPAQRSFVAQAHIRPVKKSLAQTRCVVIPVRKKD